MKTTISLFFCVLVACTSFAQQTKFALRILQNGNAISPVNGDVQLKREPFIIEMTLDNIDGVYVYADFTDAVYKLNEKDRIPDLQEVPYKVMAEENFNPSKQLFINNDSWSFWNYDKAQNIHRFDREIKTNNEHSITVTKTIQQFFVPASQKTIKVSEATQPLYLFFLVTNPFQKAATVREMARQKIKINWQ
jgi:hypothetical protein